MPQLGEQYMETNRGILVELQVVKFGWKLEQRIRGKRWGWITWQQSNEFEYF
jgi:hypothetical protein